MKSQHIRERASKKGGMKARATFIVEEKATVKRKGM
jgi:hypothetical protein